MIVVVLLDVHTGPRELCLEVRVRRVRPDELDTHLLAAIGRFERLFENVPTWLCRPKGVVIHGQSLVVELDPRSEVLLETEDRGIPRVHVVLERVRDLVIVAPLHAHRGSGLAHRGLIEPPDAGLLEIDFVRGSHHMARQPARFVYVMLRLRCTTSAVVPSVDERVAEERQHELVHATPVQHAFIRLQRRLELCVPIRHVVDGHWPLFEGVEVVFAAFVLHCCIYLDAVIRWTIRGLGRHDHVHCNRPQRGRLLCRYLAVSVVFARSDVKLDQQLGRVATVGDVDQHAHETHVHINVARLATAPRVVRVGREGIVVVVTDIFGFSITVFPIGIF